MHLSAEDVIDADLDLSQGRVVGFSLNYRALIRGRWHQVVRYDTRHGPLHVHRCWREPPDDVEPLEDAVRDVRDYRVPARQARDDLAANWPRYRTLMEERVT